MSLISLTTLSLKVGFRVFSDLVRTLTLGFGLKDCWDRRFGLGLDKKLRDIFPRFKFLANSNCFLDIHICALTN